ncbi:MULTISPECIES: hypothetical protein [Streptosporangium]|uniref:Uncharacterized protein n=1 Tax=Streptosporangium brasiliense TaxID=47480 RepID=A0ABT9RG27_9ACTN|nr:hypothetical protein [Streptosporangium brasiliense]MDP9868073.1 hypothetical protein [Streptosporangium brasiliense]
MDRFETFPARGPLRGAGTRPLAAGLCADLLTRAQAAGAAAQRPPAGLPHRAGVSGPRG